MYITGTQACSQTILTPFHCSFYRRSYLEQIFLTTRQFHEFHTGVQENYRGHQKANLIVVSAQNRCTQSWSFVFICHRCYYLFHSGKYTWRHYSVRLHRDLLKLVLHRKFCKWKKYRRAVAISLIVVGSFFCWKDAQGPKSQIAYEATSSSFQSWFIE